MQNMPGGINTSGQKTTAGRVPGAGGCASGRIGKFRGLNHNAKTMVSLDFSPSTVGGHRRVLSQ